MLRHGFQTSSASATVPTAPGGWNHRICRGTKPCRVTDTSSNVWWWLSDAGNDDDHISSNEGCHKKSKDTSKLLWIKCKYTTICHLHIPCANAGKEEDWKSFSTIKQVKYDTFDQFTGNAWRRLPLSTYCWWHRWSEDVWDSRCASRTSQALCCMVWHRACFAATWASGHSLQWGDSDCVYVTVLTVAKLKPLCR